MTTIPAPRRTSSAAFAVGALAVGGLVALVLGIYGSVHEPSGGEITTLGFGSMISMKVWLASAAGVLALGQLLGALVMYRKLGIDPPSWVGTAHRASGVLALLLTVPVAYHCLWSLGFQDYDTRVLLHSLAGCIVYGAAVTKVLVLHGRKTPGWALPLAGGLLFTVLVVTVLLSAGWYFTEIGVPPGEG